MPTAMEAVLLLALAVKALSAAAAVPYAIAAATSFISNISSATMSPARTRYSPSVSKKPSQLRQGQIRAA
ncbi:hypothetical protein BM1_10894 [Bipolaris maydis]|nr:hypothetical protein BM1_10894 [Bipolaris maydis]KAJ6284316.1 hypothetical protein J3E71DRAFT_340496 [Bipolaris maydis]